MLLPTILMIAQITSNLSTGVGVYVDLHLTLIVFLTLLFSSLLSVTPSAESPTTLVMRLPYQLVYSS
ncbi:hypothetical protein C5S31_03720 [ANME-1 cluster archaeon GoMg2]|nr:hypothetical protein [ANME-1 cluster archaeon GoMg2]